LDIEFHLRKTLTALLLVIWGPETEFLTQNFEVGAPKGTFHQKSQKSEFQRSIFFGGFAVRTGFPGLKMVSSCSDS
jgi:hypothetical protein